MVNLIVLSCTFFCCPIEFPNTRSKHFYWRFMWTEIKHLRRPMSAFHFVFTNFWSTVRTEIYVWLFWQCKKIKMSYFGTLCNFHISLWFLPSFIPWITPAASSLRPSTMIFHLINCPNSSFDVFNPHEAFMKGQIMTNSILKWVTWNWLNVDLLYNHRKNMFRPSSNYYRRF